MKLELYNVGDNEGELIKKFLINNNLPFKEVLTNDINLLNKVRQAKLNIKKSILKITYSHCIHITGYNEWDLSQLLEHIKKYKPKINLSK